MTALDRESPNVRTENGMAVFTLHVGAVDKGNPPRSSTAMVSVVCVISIQKQFVHFM